MTAEHDLNHERSLASRRQLLSESVYTTAGLADLGHPEWLIEGVLPAQAISLMYGPPGIGKSFLAVAAAMAASSGRDFLGRRATRPRNTLYVVGEGAAGMRPRAEAWEHVHGPAEEALWHNGALQLHSPTDMAALRMFVGDTKIEFIIFDTLARCTAGVEENSSREMGAVVAELDRLRDVNDCSILIVHHSGKDTSRGSRGSSAIKAAVDAELEVSGRSLRTTKMKDFPAGQPIQFTLAPVLNSLVAIEGDCDPTSTNLSKTANERRLLSTLEELSLPGGEAISTNEWMAASQLSPSSFHHGVKSLARRGEVEKISRGLYRRCHDSPSDSNPHRGLDLDDEAEQPTP